MTRERKCLLLLLLCLLSLLFGTPCSAAEYRITEDQLTKLEGELRALSENNERLQNLLTESETDLMTVNAESEELKMQLRTASAELQRLRYQLKELKAESANAEASLKIANEELKAASESLKKSKNKQERIERQRNIWEIIAGVLAVYAATK